MQAARPPPRPLAPAPRPPPRPRLAPLPATRGDDAPFGLPPAAVAAARAPWFKYGVQGGVALVVAAAVDAAYSGDWSRIGAITKETEDGLKPLVQALFAFHALCVVVAVKAAQDKGNDPARAGVKAAFVGFLAAVEAVLAEEGQG